MSNLVALLIKSLINFIDIYSFIISLYAILSWLQPTNWLAPIFSILSQLTDPYLDVLRSIIPPLGGVGISPILGVMLLQLLSQLLGSITQ